MAGSSRALSWIAVVFGVLTVAAAIWAVMDLARTGNPTLIVSLLPLLFANVLLAVVINTRKKQVKREP